MAQYTRPRERDESVAMHTIALPPLAADSAAAGKHRPPMSAKRSSDAAALPTDAPAPQRQRAPAASAAEEESTTVKVFMFNKCWLGPLAEMYAGCELTDVDLTVGDESISAHRVVLATVSRHFRALFGSGMAESKSHAIELQDVSFAALKAIVEYAYTGKLELSGSTVVAIIQAANLLQVVAVERAAVDFLVERLDAGNVLSAMALGAHLSAGEIGNDLQDKSRAWLNKNFGLVAAEPSFLQLPVAEVAAYVESDELESPEEDIFAAVMAWVKEEEAGRKGHLGRLLPLVRFPMARRRGPSAILLLRSPLYGESL